ncbi:hypothetical protein ACQ4M3_24060 [Leptolyngbya sp. AN03gr2]|uniref:hypothetical protein n=1 Tax=unclassified Leptolyngbya TaxID=2650499 RepID=UPI003D321FE1
MLKQSSLIIDPTQEQELLQVMPDTAQVSSIRLNWKQIQVANYQIPLCEAPEHTFSKHVISLNELAEFPIRLCDGDG